MRDYDPTTGRYLQADPLGLVDGASVYNYASQRPHLRTDIKGLDDIAIGIDIDLTGISGIEAGVGIVADTDTGMDSGLYGYAGNSAGANVGIGVVGTYYWCEIEGKATGLDINLPWFLSITFAWDDCGCPSLGLFVGVGAGASSNRTNADTYSFRDLVDDILDK